MIQESNPAAGITCFLRDRAGGALSVQKLPEARPLQVTESLAIAVSDADGATSGIFLDDVDRRALAAALLDGLDE